MTKLSLRWVLLAAILVALTLLALVLMYGQSREASLETPGRVEPASAAPGTPAAATKAREVAGTSTEANVARGAGGEAAPPEDKTLKLTVPKMGRIRAATVPTTKGTDEEALKQNAGIHLEGTGYPWETEANVYIAGHREGFPGTPSDQAFGDLDVLEAGDAIILTDANGSTYVYRVVQSRVVKADDLSVLRTIPGKNVVTLQSCTLPDYAERLVVRAEKEA